jgi:alkanesulfonate monooxygenase SsuD/methylene tetrahydromethanopterin reductase-like flavin-dependent oxidoreductase (luciferase family)
MANSVRFGFGFDMRNPAPWHKPWPQLYAETIELVEHLEALGFGQVWFAEHHGADDGDMPSPIVFGAGVATRTKKVRISQAVGLLPHYHPVRLAEDMAVLDILSNGRAELGMGIGYLPWEADAYGFRKRGKVSDEILDIVRRLWQGEAVDYDGEFFQLKGARCTPLPCQQGGIPIYVASVSPPGFRRAAAYGDGYIGHVQGWPGYLEEVRKVGKDPSKARMVGMDMWLLVSEDPERTLEEVAPHVYYQVSSYADWQEDSHWVPLRDMGLDAFKKSGTITVLTPEECIAHFKSQLEKAPIEAFCMQVASGFPAKQVAEHAELFAKKVLPAF